MKRGFATFIIVIAIFSGLPEATRRCQAVRHSGASGLRSKMLEGFIKSTGDTDPSQVKRRCEPAPKVKSEQVNSNADGTAPTDQLIGRVKLGANLYVIK